jgi:RNA polymerase sigma factor (sigma-70 family)
LEKVASQPSLYGHIFFVLVFIPSANRLWYHAKSTEAPMKPDEESRVESDARFRTTQWTLVMLAAESSTPAAESALAELYQIYWFPLYAFARRRGRSPHDAQDLTQGFFVDLIEHKALTKVDQLKGKFRSFLLASFKNHLLMEAHRARCLKRGGVSEFVSLDMKDAEDRYALEPAECLSAEKLFDAQWAITLLRQAMTRLHEEYSKRGKASAFDALKAFVNKDESKDSLSYNEAAKLLGVRLASAKTLIYRFRKQYSAFVREEIARTVSDPTEVDEEIRALCDALIISGGGMGE